MNRLWENVTAFYNNLDAEKRRYFWLALVLGGIFLTVAYIWGTHVPQQTLLSGRSIEELYQAAGALDAAEISYTIDQSRGTITVPSSQWGAAGSVVATANVLPSMQDVSNLPMGVNPSAQEWAMVRQKEGDLARVIQGWTAIHSAVVSIVPMTETFAFEEPRPGSAAVAITLKPGSSLDKQGVNTITHIVASAVTGLDPDNVTVSDNHGNLLAEGQQGENSANPNDPNNLFERKILVENRVERNVRKSLRGLLGVGNHFTVTANVDLEMTSSQVRSHVVTSGKPALISENITESTQERMAPGGAPGVDAHLPERQAATTARGGDQKSEESQMVNNYDHPKTDEVIVRPAGSINRVSVAVNVNEASISTITGASPGDEKWTEYEQKIRQAVQGAIGYDEKRSDIVSLQILPFADLAVAPVEEPIVTVSALTPLGPHAIAAMALILAFFFIVRPVMQQIDRSRTLELNQASRPKKDDASSDTEELLASRLHHLVENFQPIDSGDLNKLVANQPNLAAQVIKKWNRNAS